MNSTGGQGVEIASGGAVDGGRYPGDDSSGGLEANRWYYIDLAGCTVGTVNSFQQAETSGNQVETLLHLIKRPTFAYA